MRTDYVLPSRLVPGSWQSPRRALRGPRTTANTVCLYMLSPISPLVPYTSIYALMCSSRMIQSSTTRIIIPSFSWSDYPLLRNPPSYNPFAKNSCIIHTDWGGLAKFSQIEARYISVVFLAYEWEGKLTQQVLS